MFCKIIMKIEQYILRTAGYTRMHTNWKMFIASLSIWIASKPENVETR